MPIIEINTPFNIDLEFELTPVHKRAFAYLIDFTLLLAFFITMKSIYYGGYDSADANTIKSRIGIDIITISLPMLLYSLVTEVIMHGQTIGKKLMKIKVISLEGGEPTLGQYLLRWMFKVYEWPFFFGYAFFSKGMLVAYVFITLFLGGIVVIIIAVTKRNQRVGDLAANTAVVNMRSLFTVHDTVFMNIQSKDYKVTFPEVLKLTDRDINTVKNVIISFYHNHNTVVINKIASKIKNSLNLQTSLYDIDFLEKLLEDYNYLATKE
jgi:uncharacterized RDD family membrane protein YckC